MHARANTHIWTHAQNRLQYTIHNTLEFYNLLYTLCVIF